MKETISGLDRWLTTEPDYLTNDAPEPDDDGCADCGHALCRCDSLCPNCGMAFRSKAEAEAGTCVECQQGYYDTQRGER
jgi:predicted amidophosphoribosyltransferase